MPPRESLDWKKTQMNNWAQYGSKVDNIIIHLNMEKNQLLSSFLLQLTVMIHTNYVTWCYMTVLERPKITRDSWN